MHIGLGSLASPMRKATGPDFMVVGDRVWTQEVSSLLSSAVFLAPKRPVLLPGVSKLLPRSQPPGGHS